MYTYIVKIKYVCAFMLFFSCVWLFATLWTVALQAPLSMEFSRKNTGDILQGIFLTEELSTATSDIKLALIPLEENGVQRI